MLSLPLIHRSALPAAVGGILLGLALPATAVRAQENKVEFPQASPRSVLKQRVGTTDIEIDYSRPGKNGREIFGALVPWAAVWRTGANASTKISFSDAVKIGDKEIPAGKYSLYTIPNANDWTIILHKDTSLWGAYKYKQENDVARVTVKPETAATPVETFTIGLDDVKEDSATLALEWDKTRVPVKLTTNTVEKVSAAIEKAAASGGPLEGPFYFGAANFYLAHNKDLDKALGWIDKAIEKNPKSWFVMFKKAEIQAKKGDKAGATATAEKAIAAIKAEPEPDAGDIAMVQKFIAGLR